ncbi:MAG: outer membrane lipoprotein carrier protein LolA [Bacteroidetes bacterium SW_9_63_38]|nr:MAG: outer membrane lipoprotein carrier protein LolA [Bacteroidetes bacterium SW_9_63_38]
MRRVLLLTVLLLGLAHPALAQRLSLSSVQDAYEALDGLQASFTQVIASSFADGSTRVEGAVLLSGNKYRVRTPNQTVVTDGETTWIYTPADSQVVVNDADTEGAVTPETFLTASDDLYKVQSSQQTTRGGRPHVQLTIASTDSSSRFAEATLWVRTEDRIVTRMRATDRNGSILNLRLHSITLNPDTLQSDAPFTFSPPSGVRVVDLRRRK